MNLVTSVTIKGIEDEVYYAIQNIKAMGAVAKAKDYDTRVAKLLLCIEELQSKIEELESPRYVRQVISSSILDDIVDMCVKNGANLGRFAPRG